MKKKILITCSVIGVLFFSFLISFFTVKLCGKKVKLEKGNEIVASIKGKNFTAEELFDMLKEKHGKDVLLDMIDTYIINEEIDDETSYKKAAAAELSSMKSYYNNYNYNWKDVLSYYGYETDEDFKKGYIQNAKKKDIAKKYLKEDITDKEIDVYYEKEIYGDYTAKHILITPKEDSEDAKNEAKEKAEEVIQKLNDGASWSTLVKEYSDDDTSKENDGNVGTFTKGDMVDSFFEATIELKENTYTKEPVESSYGYHIIYLISKTDKPSKEDSMDKIKDGICENKLNNNEELYNNTWEKIRDIYELDITDTVVEDAYKKES